MKKHSSSQLLIDVPEACRQLSIGKTTFYELVRDPENELPLIKINNRTLLHHADVERFAERLRADAHRRSATTLTSAPKFPSRERTATEPSGAIRNRASSDLAARMKGPSDANVTRDERPRTSTARPEQTRKRIIRKNRRS
jgi:excisionase family DNA binding protein